MWLLGQPTPFNRVVAREGSEDRRLQRDGAARPAGGRHVSRARDRDGKLAIRKTDSVDALTAPSHRAIVAAIRRILEAPFSAAASLACTAPNKRHVQSEGCQGASRDSAAKAGHDCDTLCCTR